MKREHKLRLVTPVEPMKAVLRDDVFPDELAPTDEELAEAEALRLSMERGDDALVGSLRAAHGLVSTGLSSTDVPLLDEAKHAAMIDRALSGSSTSDVADEPPTASERLGADRLRDALADPRGRLDEVPLVSVGITLRAAYRPRDIEPLRNEALIARALSAASSRRKTGRMVPLISAIVVGVTAVAAGIALYVAPMGGDASVASAPALVRSRSAVDLFDPATPFPRAGGESARVDRIASARAVELRNNRFALWGVR